MIRIISVILFSLLPMSFMQTTGDLAQDINKAIEQGNARNLARFLGPNIEMFIPGSEGTFSRSQAEIILRDFFVRNAPEKLVISHQRSTRDGSLYVIGNMHTKDGSQFRVYYMIKSVSQNSFLHQLQIEAR